jgi:hypothetical protein
MHNGSFIPAKNGQPQDQEGNAAERPAESWPVPPLIHMRAWYGFDRHSQAFSSDKSVGIRRAAVRGIGEQGSVADFPCDFLMSFLENDRRNWIIPA